MNCSRASSASDGNAADEDRKTDTRIRHSVSSVVPLLSCVRRITRRRFARFVTDSISESALASLLTKLFLHKSFGMLNAPLRRFLRSHALRARGAPPAIVKTRMHGKPIYYRHFLTIAKTCGLRCSMALRNAPCALPVLVQAQHLVSVRGPKPCNVQKHWCFCSAVVIR